MYTIALLMNIIIYISQIANLAKNIWRITKLAGHPLLTNFFNWRWGLARFPSIPSSPGRHSGAAAPGESRTCAMIMVMTSLTSSMENLWFWFWKSIGMIIYIDFDIHFHFGIHDHYDDFDPSDHYDPSDHLWLKHVVNVVVILIVIMMPVALLLRQSLEP